MILIDNYDSFTYNIVQYLQELGVKPRVFKNDEVTIEELKNIDFNSVIISPGPGNPCDKNSTGVCGDIVKEFYTTKKILGVCLGHQLIASHFGARIVKDPEPYHGKTSKIYIERESKLFKDIPNGFEATRYHSLKAVDLPHCIIPLAYTDDKILMALKHRDYEVYGVQFHPEAILTQYGHRLFENFLNIVLDT
ncbi:MAG TPA: aminodeoxychorismate/anthranilate synthase component II [Candidatus Limenecus avicola]|uniref:Aminodeoxychorismate/anthranilate synthase component II n=1 Tax=Candidatus Limenecus avicola TaxID=2840847 RepID=A0A9D1MYP5_9CLOT|nr:aminodeoxychorismate/anthranilate synthase component II [Candidatus Limenecus avicola]